MKMNNSEQKILTWLLEQNAIDSNISSVDKVIRLDLSSRNLSEVPEEIGLLCNLMALNLANNRLSSLPDTMAELQKLSNIDIRRNSFKVLPSVFAKMQLRSIIASANALRDVSVLKHCLHVRVLDLSSNALRDIRGCISEANELRTINLSSNLFDDLTELFSLLRTIERVNINDNLLKELPFTVCEMEMLEEFDASYNHIEKIDKAFFSLSVERIDLSSNLIHTLRLRDLEDLEALTLDDNPFRKLTLDAGFAPYLKEFSCDGCSLKEFLLPSSSELRILCYSSNNISVVPKEIGMYVNLEELDIDENKITELPQELANLSYLETLYVNGNPLNEEAKKVITILDPEICDMNMKTGITIQKAEYEDLAEMAKLIAVLFAIERDFTINYDKQLAGITRLFEHESSDMLVAKYEGKVVGMVTMQRLISSAEGDYVGQIEDLVVYDEYRKMGVGSRLLNKMRSLALEHGYKRIQLAADMDNKNALEFYNRRGFKKTNLNIYHYLSY